MLLVRPSATLFVRKTFSLFKPLCNAGPMACFYIAYFPVLMNFVFMEKEIQGSTENVRFVFGMSVLSWTLLRFIYIVQQDTQCGLNE